MKQWDPVCMGGEKNDQFTEQVRFLVTWLHNHH